MTTHQIADGWNNQAGLTDLNPQPFSEGIRPYTELGGFDGSIDESDLYDEWVCGEEVDWPTYASFNTQCGLSRAVTVNDVTIRTIHQGVWVDANATIQRPNPKRVHRLLGDNELFEGVVYKIIIWEILGTV